MLKLHPRDHFLFQTADFALFSGSYTISQRAALIKAGCGISSKVPSSEVICKNVHAAEISDNHVSDLTFENKSHFFRFLKGYVKHLSQYSHTNHQ